MRLRTSLPSGYKKADLFLSVPVAGNDKDLFELESDFVGRVLHGNLPFVGAVLWQCPIRFPGPLCCAGAGASPPTKPTIGSRSAHYLEGGSQARAVKYRHLMPTRLLLKDEPEIIVRSHLVGVEGVYLPLSFPQLFMRRVFYTACVSRSARTGTVVLLVLIAMRLVVLGREDIGGQKTR